ncbi:hypothetical protein F528_1988 [Neisseria meningitidis 992008]|nr:hypothetical protein F528_1988 [Neisseria meningitidis 992008]
MILNLVIPKWAEIRQWEAAETYRENGKPSAVIPAQAGI